MDAEIRRQGIVECLDGLLVGAADGIAPARVPPALRLSRGRLAPLFSSSPI